MTKTVTEAHPLLYHYTTAAGLDGIVKTQQLRATNISYLNDAEEHTGYFDWRLPQLLERAARGAIADVRKTVAGKKRIDELGGEVKAIAEAKKLGMHIRKVTLEFNNPYVVSFCPIPKIPDNGLLSQWRGYGVDGGYAILFDTQELEKLLFFEEKTFHYQTSFWGDVDYYDEDTPEKARHPETIEQEHIVETSLRTFFLSGEQDALDPLHLAITRLSCAHKHEGFLEEREFRIVAVPANDSLRQEGRKLGDMRPQKPVYFAMKNGTLVPYIMLFEPGPSGKQTKLPIKKIIVGPHPDKQSRKKSAESLLRQYGIDAEVVFSKIPYLGR